MKTALIFILLLHGLIHLMGFVKAFELAKISDLTLSISRGWGLLWLTAAVVLILSSILLLLNVNSWWMAALTGAILSQTLIFAFWQDARIGTMANLIILIFIITGLVRHTPPASIMSDDAAPAPYEERYGSVIPHDPAKIINPFSFHIIPMERLLLINIENDPDRLYTGFEPQVFDDETNGTGMLVIAWRTDGKVDVYHQPTVTPDPDGYDIAARGLENMVPREMPGAFLELNEHGAQADVRFEDVEGRLIQLKLAEHSTRARKPFGLLAPMGMAAENPSAMPLILLHDFYFVRRNNTDLSVIIDGRNHTPDNLPLPLDFTRMSFARYCPNPLIATLNPAFEGMLPFLPLEDDPSSPTRNNPANSQLNDEPARPLPGNPSSPTLNNNPASPLPNDSFSIHHDDHTIDLIMNKGIPEIRSISRNHGRHCLGRRYHGRHTITLAFSPAFPNLEAFQGENAEGFFEISGDESTGFIRGAYRVMRSNDHFTVELIPSGGWIPNERKLSLRFLYSVEPMFKQWPTTYRWKAELVTARDSGFQMKSNWKRIHSNPKP